jgi:RNA polymerase sigma factor FliA
MRLSVKGSSTPPQNDVLIPFGPLTKSPFSGSAEQKPRGDPTVSVLPRQGDLLTEEQERAMTEHLPIVRFIARRIHARLPQHVAIEDLYSAGVIGLLDAFGRFDPSRKIKFRTYAQFRIRGAMLDSLRSLDWSPRDLRRKGRAVERAIQALIGQLNRSPTRLRPLKN